MRFTDLGFIFILLPLAAVWYYLFPKRARPAALFFISAFFFLLADPRYLYLFAALLPDFAFTSLAGRAAAGRRALYCRLIVLKNLLIMLIFGLALPLMGHIEPPFGAVLLCLTSTEFVIMRSREAYRPCGFFEAAASVAFFGRMYHGPVGGVRKLISQLQKSPPSLASVSQGAMRIICGTAKRVILADQFFALFKTISRMSAAQYSTALGWLCALCGGMGIYFTLSAYSDIARGIAQVFSVTLPRTVYFPFQAKSLRDYVYRLNMPLEDALNRILLPGSRREDGTAANYLVSFMMPPMLALLFSPTGGFFIWSLCLSGLIAADWLILRRVPAPVALFSRVATFLITLPSYLLLLPASLSNRGLMLLSLIPNGGFPLINDDAVYLLTSHAPMLFVGLLGCTSLLDALSHATEKQLPQLWWVISAAAHVVILALTVSFLLWNVR